VATFLIETYLSQARAAELDDETARLRDAIAGLTIDPAIPTPPVQWLFSYFVPEDEMCLHVVEAESVDAVLRVCSAAGLAAERVVEAEAAESARRLTLTRR